LSAQAINPAGYKRLIIWQLLQAQYLICAAITPHQRPGTCSQYGRQNHDWIIALEPWGSITADQVDLQML